MSSKSDGLEIQHRVPAEVFASLSPGRLTLHLASGVGLGDGCIPVDVDIAIIPPHLRLPNTEVTVLMGPSDRGFGVVGVET